MFINGTGYLSEVQPNYNVICGAQAVQGDLLSFANETIVVYNNLGTNTMTTATNATNEEEMVVYRKQDNGMWVRPRADFEGFTLVDGAQVRRFTKI